MTPTTQTIESAIMAGLLQQIDECEASAREAYARMIKGADRDAWGRVAQSADERAEDARDRGRALLEGRYGVSADELLRRLG